MDIGDILNDGPEAEWYTIPGTEVQVQIANVKPGRRRELMRQATRVRFVRGQRIEWRDEEELGRLLLNEYVCDWKNIKRNGDEFPCTPENKNSLDYNWGEFSTFWNNIVAKFNATEEALEETERGNS